MADENPVDDVVAAMALFGELLKGVTHESLELETPCEGWDVRALVAHVVLGDASVPLLLAGSGSELTVGADPSILGNNPMATWRGTALGAIRAFQEPGAMEREVAQPNGSVTGEFVARVRLVDLLGHSWDLARALGNDLELPERLTEASLDFLFPHVGRLIESGIYGSPVQPRDEANAAERFLALIGRSAD